ncbi:MAG: Transposase [Bacteroidetes bacterium]|nr:Transposase [Bacteroidota bacterium]
MNAVAPSVGELNCPMPVMDCTESATAAFTVFVRHKMPLFTDETVVRKFEGILLSDAEKSHCEAPVYLFMPYRCHLLLQGKGGQANLVRTIRSFRIGAGYWLSRVRCDAEWHENHDGSNHTMQEEILKYARHILITPVRMGLVANWKQYRYKGSTLYDLETWL